MGITEELQWEGTLGDHLVQPLCSARGDLQHVAQDCAQWVLNDSEDGDYTKPLGNLYHCVATLTVNIFFILVFFLH